MKDILKKSDADLRKFLSEKRESLRSLRFGTSGSGSRNVKAIKNTKKEVAQALTELNARAKKAAL